MSERQLAAVCHFNTLVDCVSKSSPTLFPADSQTHGIPQNSGRAKWVSERKSHALSFQMQLSAPRGSIVILSGSRLFWNVCEARWVTESTFTLTHACDIINLSAALAHTGPTRHAPVQTNSHATRSESDKRCLLLGWALWSPPLSRTHRAPGWRRGPSVSQHCPLPRSRFLGMAAFSSWLDWSSLNADSRLLAA